MPSRYTLSLDDKIDLYASLTCFKKRMMDKSNKTRRIPKKSHYHTCYEIVLATLFTNTVSDYVINDKIYKINSKCVVGAPPGVEHYPEPVDKKKRLIINFSHEYGKEIFDFLGVDIKDFFASPVWCYTDEQIEKMFEIGEEIVKESKNMWEKDSVKTRRDYYIKVLFLNLVNILVNPVEFLKPIYDNSDEIDAIINFLKRNYKLSFNLDMLANEFGVNKYVMCRKFKEKIGDSIISFVNLIKLNHARELLEETNLTINEIATDIGFSSGKYFSAEFKKNVGISPVLYRKNYLANNKK